jgi:hypothetical protein
MCVRGPKSIDSSQAIFDRIVDLKDALGSVKGLHGVAFEGEVIRIS